MRAAAAALLLVALAPATALVPDAPVPGAVLVGYEGDPATLQARLIAAGAVVHHVLEGPRVLVLEAPDAPALRALAPSLPGVRYAELDPGGTFEGVPNDQLYPAQWGLHEVRAAEAWDTVPGSDIVVAVLDTGLYLHPDLAPNLWRNPGEVPFNQQDDDGNGFVDDWRGWDFGDNDSEPQPRPVSNAFNHGTMVAGVLAAVTDNVLGVAGLAQVKVMDLKIADGAPIPRAGYAAAAAEYAVENGAKVLLMAWKVGESQALAETLRWAHGEGVLLVKSAGNWPDQQVFFPGTLPEVLNVGALQPGGTVSPWSVRDDRVELTAPGLQVATTIFPVVLNQVVPIFLDPNFPHPGYALGNGTSFAAPFVAGTAALVWALQPSLTHEEVRALLAATADDRGSPGRDPAYGHGVLDAAAAVRAAATL